MHTVRDHLTSTFAKVGASSRTELVARLLHQHHGEGLTAPAHDDGRQRHDRAV